MPLRAVLDGEQIESFTYVPESWTALKAAYKSRSLVTECCGERAIPKVSKRGTQFFAHVRRGECTSAAETPEHLYLKWVVAQAAHDAGWLVTTEYAGTTPDGEEWIADVFCQGREACFAVEVQWSPQTLETYKERQARYAASGVRALWLYRVNGNRSLFDALLPTSKDLPLFGVCKDAQSGSFHVPGFGVKVETFATDMLAGHLKWRPRPGTCKRAGLITDIERCRRCNHDVEMVRGVMFHEEGIQLRYESFGDDAVAEFVYALIQGASIEWKVRVERQYSKTLGRAYIANVCRACLGIQGRHFQLGHEIDVLAADIPEPTVVLDVPAALEIPAEHGWYLRERAYSPHRRPELPQSEKERV